MTTPAAPLERRVWSSPRTWIVAGLAAISTADPTLATIAAPFAALGVLLFGDLPRFRVGATIGWTLAFIGWTMLSGMWTVNPEHLNTALSRAAVAALFIAIIDFVRNREQLVAASFGFLAGALVTVVRIATGTPQLMAGSGERVTTVLGDLNINYIGYTLSAAFSVAVLLWSTSNRDATRFRALILLMMAAILGGVELTQTRGAYVGIALAITWILLCKALKIRSLWLVGCSLLAVAAAQVFGALDKASLILERGDRATGDWSGRLPLWESARSIWAQDPIIGIGVGGFRFESGFQIAAHSAVLDIGVGLGVIGLALFALLLRSALWRDSKPLDGHWRALLIGTFVASSAPAYFTGVWDGAPAAWIVLAIFARVSVLSHSGSQSPPSAFADLTEGAGIEVVGSRPIRGKR